MRPQPGFRLAAFWFLYMAGLGTFFPFYGLYLQERLGLHAAQVGLVMAAIPAVGLLAQPFWGLLADRSGSRRGVLAAAVAGAAMAYLALGLLRGFPAVLAGTAALALFQTAVLPMTTALTLGTVGQRSFGLVRLWGTVGFLVLVMCFPPLLGLWRTVSPADSPFADLGLMFPVIAGLSAAAGATALLLPAAGEVSLRAAGGEAFRLLRHAPVVRLLMLVFLAHLLIQGPIQLFPLYVVARGGDAGTLGGMWVAMLLLEIPLIALSSQTLRRLGPRGLLAAGLAAEGLRWTVCALATDLEVIRAVQLLHGFAVAGILVGAPLYLEQAVPARLRSTGQTLVSSIGLSAGSILSATLTGALMERLGVEVPYALSGLGCLALAAGLWAFLPVPWKVEVGPAAEDGTGAV